MPLGIWRRRAKSLINGSDSYSCRMLIKEKIQAAGDL